MRLRTERLLGKLFNTIDANAIHLFEIILFLQQQPMSFFWGGLSIVFCSLEQGLSILVSRRQNPWGWDCSTRLITEGLLGAVYGPGIYYTWASLLGAVYGPDVEFICAGTCLQRGYKYKRHQRPASRRITNSRSWRRLLCSLLNPPALAVPWKQSSKLASLLLSEIRVALLTRGHALRCRPWCSRRSAARTLVARLQHC